MLGADLGVNGYRAREVSSGRDPMGGVRITVDRRYRGPDRPLQEVL